MVDGVDVSPEFNSGIDYLKRIGYLMTTAHVASVNDEDFQDWFWVLEQLHIEIDPRLSLDERKELEMLRNKAEKSVSSRTNIRLYHLSINRLAHSHGLIMRDVSDLPGVLSQ